MKRGALILLLGLIIATAAFSGFYYLGTTSCRNMMLQPNPELVWLKKEFHLSDAEFARVTALHEAYLPQCAQRCQHIAEQNGKLEELLSQSSTVTPEISNLLLDRARLRAECEAEMLKHFLEVSRTMPPEQGRRYLQWVEQNTCLDDQAMEARHHLLKGHHHE